MLHRIFKIHPVMITLWRNIMTATEITHIFLVLEKKSQVVYNSLFTTQSRTLDAYVWPNLFEPVDTCLLSASGDLLTFRRDTHYYHNVKRTIHSAPSLILDDELNRNAQDFALSLAQRKTVEHSQPEDRKGQGENIAMVCKTPPGRVKLPYATTWASHQG